MVISTRFVRIGSGSAAALTDPDGRVGDELVGRHFEVKRGRAERDAARGIVIGAVTGAEPAASVSHRAALPPAERTAAKMRADPDDDSHSSRTTRSTSICGSINSLRSTAPRYITVTRWPGSIGANRRRRHAQARGQRDSCCRSASQTMAKAPVAKYRKRSSRPLPFLLSAPGRRPTSWIETRLGTLYYGARSQRPRAMLSVSWDKYWAGVVGNR